MSLNEYSPAVRTSFSNLQGALSLAGIEDYVISYSEEVNLYWPHHGLFCHILTTVEGDFGEGDFHVIHIVTEDGKPCIGTDTKTFSVLTALNIISSIVNCENDTEEA